MRERKKRGMISRWCGGIWWSQEGEKMSLETEGGERNLVKSSGVSLETNGGLGRWRWRGKEALNEGRRET